MSVPETTTRLIDRHMGRIVLFCVVGTCCCLAWLGFQQVQVSSQASEGQKARDRQVRVMPVSCKEHTDAWRRRLITFTELTRVLGCPTPAPTP